MYNSMTLNDKITELKGAKWSLKCNKTMYRKYKSLERALTLVYFMCGIIFSVIGFIIVSYKDNTTIPYQPCIIMAILIAIMGIIYFMIYYTVKRNISKYAKNIRQLKIKIAKLEKSIEIDITNETNFREIQNYFENNWFLEN